MKTLNLVIAIIFTIIYGMLLLSGLLDSDSDLVVGIVVMSAPVVVNWITFAKL